MEFEPKRYIATGLAILAGSTLLAGCNDVAVTSETRQIENTTPKEGTFTWKDSKDDKHTKSISCVGTSLVLVDKDHQLLGDGTDTKTFLQDPACADQELSANEVGDFLISEILDVKPQN